MEHSLSSSNEHAIITSIAYDVSPFDGVITSAFIKWLSVVSQMSATSTYEGRLLLGSSSGERGEPARGDSGGCNASCTIESKLSGISPLSSKLVHIMVLLCCPTIVLLHGELCVEWIRRPGPAILLI